MEEITHEEKELEEMLETQVEEQVEVVSNAKYKVRKSN